MERMTNNDALPGTDTVYIIVDGATVVGRSGGDDGPDTTIVYYRDLNGRNRFVRRANASVFLTAREAGETLDANAADAADAYDTQHDEDRDYAEEEYNRRTMHDDREI
jgi:hypothetical protein